MFFFCSDIAGGGGGGGGDGAHTILFSSFPSIVLSVRCSSVKPCFFSHSFQVVLFIAGIILVESSMVAFELVQTTSENNKNTEKKARKRNLRPLINLCVYIVYILLL